MEQSEIKSHQESDFSFDEKISELIHEGLLFTEESMYVRMPMGVEFYDANGFLRSINDYALNMYGVDDRTSVVNKVNLFESPYVDEALEAKIKSGEDITLEFEYDFDRIREKAYYVTRNTNTMIFETKVAAIRDKKGAIIGHILLSNDVTAIKEAEYRTEETKKNLEMAMDAANMSSWVYDIRQGVFNSLYGTPVATDGMGMEDVLAILHPQDHAILKQLFSQLINKELQDAHMTLRFYNKEQGQYRYYESRMRLSTEHLGKTQLIGTELDVTERLQTAKEAQELSAKRELALRVGNIVHWDFDVRTQKFESFNDPLNRYVRDRLLTIQEYLAAIHPEDHRFFKEAVESMASGKDVSTNFTCRLRTSYDESWQYCDFTCVPFEKDENGNVIRFTGFRQNIPKLQKLNRELKERNYKLELSFKTVGMSYWDCDVKGRQFKAFNDPVNDFDSERIITAEDYLAFTHPDDVEYHRDCINRMYQGMDASFNFKYRSKTKWDDEWQTLLVTGIQIENDPEGRVTRYTGITINNTKWEKMIQELKALKEKAELSDKLKSAFLANMSHEIRTPLNAIVGFSELMTECKDPEEQAVYVDIIKTNNELLLRLINDILDLSKIEAGILERKCEKFNVRNVSDELYSIMCPKMASQGIAFLKGEPNGDLWVNLDKNRLMQVWMNFLTNAVKHTKSGHVKMGYSVEREGIRIYVEDTGIGIPEELQDKIFNRFQKLDDFVQGAGLGLAISKAIVEIAGGSIGVSSKPGFGSTFWAWLPSEVWGA